MQNGRNRKKQRNEAPGAVHENNRTVFNLLEFEVLEAERLRGSAAFMSEELNELSCPRLGWA
jgi:hypothetical protein